MDKVMIIKILADKLDPIKRNIVATGSKIENM
jgi:hypothetical protein